MDTEASEQEPIWCGQHDFVEDRPVAGVSVKLHGDTKRLSPVLNLAAGCHRFHVTTIPKRLGDVKSDVARHKAFNEVDQPRRDGWVLADEAVIPNGHVEYPQL